MNNLNLMIQLHIIIFAKIENARHKLKLVIWKNIKRVKINYLEFICQYNQKKDLILLKITKKKENLIISLVKLKNFDYLYIYIYIFKNNLRL